MTYGIYCIEHIDSGRKYIGKSKNIEARLKKHRYVLARKSLSREANRYLWACVHKYGIDSFKFYVVEEVTPQDDNLLADREVFWMDALNTLDRAFGFNLRRDSSSGVTVSEETKRLISESKRGEKHPNFGKHRSAETIENIRNATVGKKRSDESKERMRIARSGEKNHNFNKKFSDKHRERIRLALTGKKRPRNVVDKITEAKSLYSFEAIDPKTGYVVKTYQRSKDLLKDGHDVSSVYKVFKGLHKTYHGYAWRKIPKLEITEASNK